MLVYLLHFDSRIGRSLHYMGITREDRLEARMREHAAGHGAALTARACALNIGWTVVATWPGLGWQDEREMKRRGRYHTRCCVCTPRLTDATSPAKLLHIEPVARSEPVDLLNW